MTFVWGILGLSFLVFFHETGHFLAAKACGVTVEAFSIGMGPILLHKTYKGVDYRLSLIPIGGYCAMKGEKDYQKALEEGLDHIQGEADSFYGAHPLKRLIIAFAGPFFNFLFAFIAFFAIALLGYTYFSAGTTVSMTDDTEAYKEVSSPAHEAGMQSGDTILSINGKPMADFSDIATYISLRGGEDVTITVDRGGETMDIVVHAELDKETGAGRIGIVSSEDSFVERQYGPFPPHLALQEGFSQTCAMLFATVKGIATLFKGVKITSAVSGPVRITSLLGETVQQGFTASAKIGIVSTLELLALISISLFLTNLLPVPVLDGGLILFALIEWILRKKISPKVLYYIQFIGIAFIIFMFGLAVVGDVGYFMNKFHKTP